MPEVRLIDANALKKEFCDYCSAMDTDMQTCDGNCDTLRIVDEQPTIEPEVQLAHWIPGKRGKWSCSCCGNEIYCTSADDLQRNHEFCGHCGAEMKDQCDMRTLIEEAIL